MGETKRELLRRHEELRARLEEAEETLHAIRSGEVDAIVVSGPEGERVFTLAGAEHPYRALVEAISEGAVTLAAGGYILYCNRSFAGLLQTPLQQLIGSTITRFVAPEDTPLFERLLEQGLGSGGGKEEMTLLAAGGRPVRAYLSIHPLQLDDTSAACLVVTDLTEQKRMEEVVAAEKLARSILEQASEAIVVCDTEGRIIRASSQAYRLSDKSLGAEELFDHVFPLRSDSGWAISQDAQDRQDVRQMSPLAVACRGEMVLGQEVTLDRSDGEALTLLLNAGPLYSPEHKVLGCVVTMTDVTKRKRAEEQLRMARDELEARVEERTIELRGLTAVLLEEVKERRTAERQIRELLRQLISVQENERRRIARDLHDHLGQQMTALKLSLEMLRKQCGEVSELSGRVEQTQAIAQRLDADVDFLTWELRPAALDHLGLVPALATFVQDWSKHFGITAEIHTNGLEAVRLSPEAEINLYRILQETLNNTSKHAEASSVSVLLERKTDEIVLIVEDDGRGFDPEAQTAAVRDGGGLGIIGIRERAQLAGGCAEIESSPGAGTTVFVRVPLVKAEEGGEEE